MLNRRMILDKYNEKHPEKKIRSNNDLVMKFLDMGEQGITNEMIIELIEDGSINSREELLDPNFIKGAYGANHTNSSTPSATDHVFNAEVNLDPPKAGLLGGFEDGIAQMVTQLVGSNLKPMLDEKFDDYVVNNPAKTRKTIEYFNPNTGYSTTEVHHECFDEVVAYVQNNLNVLLVGSAGTGKNHLCKQVADFLGLTFYFANAVTQEYKLTGFIDANGNYHPTQFYNAYKDGGLFMFDELDGSDPNALVTFNGALSNGYMDFPVGRVDMHPNFRAVACANTWGTGASSEYVGRYPLDAATRNRFGTIEVGYDTNIERSMTNDEELIQFLHRFRSYCEKYGIRHIASYRDLKRLDTLKPVIGIIKALKSGLLMNLEQDDLNMMVNDFAEYSDEWSEAFCEIARGC